MLQFSCLFVNVLNVLVFFKLQCDSVRYFADASYYCVRRDDYCFTLLCECSLLSFLYFMYDYIININTLVLHGLLIVTEQSTGRSFQCCHISEGVNG